MKARQTNPKNDQLKRAYLIYLKEARQRSATTVDQARHAIDRLEEFTGYADFGTFNKEQAIGFKKALIATKAQRSGKPISISTADHILRSIRDFFGWLQSQPGYRNRIKPSDIPYLNLSTKEVRAAHASRPKQYATLEQYRAALLAMPTDTEVERRDRALLAFMLLTGMRVAAVISLKLKHIAIERRYVHQDPHEVDTKASKLIETFFYPVGDDIEAIVTDWVQYLTTEKLFGPNDPVFPKTAISPTTAHGFIVTGLTREHWANTTPVRTIFKSAFTRINLPYTNPHTVRDTLVQLAYKLQLTAEQLKAWSQGLGHESVLTTMSSYGHVSIEKQGEIMEDLARRGDTKPGDDLANEILASVTKILRKQQV